MLNDEDKIDWLRLDNAAKIFPAARSSRWNNIFRCSAVLKSRIDKDILQEAVESAIKRYPMFQVTLRKGIFWYYFQKTNTVPKVTAEENYPCSMFDLKSNDLLFRVLYSRNRISVEFFHSLSDGYGAVCFLNTILLKYFHLQGKKIPPVNVLHYDDVPDEEEFEDSYKRYSRPELGSLSRKEPVAYHMRGAQELPGVLNVIMGEMPTSDLKDVSKKYGVTINQLIVGIVAYIIYKRKLYDNKAKPKHLVKIQTAINLRKIMPSRTLRNFSAIVNVQLKEDDKHVLSFEEVLEKTTAHAKELASEELMYKFINANTSAETNPIMRVAPLFLKNFAMKIAHYNFGEKLISISVSNMGIAQAPEEFKHYVDRYEHVIGPQKYLNYAMTVGSYNNKTVITCSRKVKNSSFEREFYRFLSSLGIPVKINSNHE